VKKCAWLTPKQIAELPNMPGTIQGVHKKAQREGWQSQKRHGVQGPGIEYYISIPEGYEVEDKLPKATPSVDAKALAEHFVFIPGYSVQVSAGHGTHPSEFQEPSRYLAFRKKWLQFRGFSEKSLVIVWAKGDSMEPTIHNNDTLVINTDRKKLTDGHIFVIRYDDTLWVKRIQIRSESWLLISDNTIYPPIEVAHRDQDSFEVVGQVVHIAKDIGD
jgi:phage repressor protein C with HTH and peptisase S24 domain